MSSNSHSFVTFIHLTIDSVFQGKFEYKQTIKLLSKKKKKKINQEDIFGNNGGKGKRKKAKIKPFSHPILHLVLNFFFLMRRTPALITHNLGHFQ